MSIFKLLFLQSTVDSPPTASWSLLQVDSLELSIGLWTSIWLWGRVPALWHRGEGGLGRSAISPADSWPALPETAAVVRGLVAAPRQTPRRWSRRRTGRSGWGGAETAPGWGGGWRRASHRSSVLGEGERATYLYQSAWQGQSNGTDVSIPGLV